ncbi:protocadherin-8-like [Tiliqua scincoides]|uniref:protocadherin-8-like n=1 Tax=Tiliqua scincoides TaxID=71010 RepID=UPI0034624FBA
MGLSQKSPASSPPSPKKPRAGARAEDREGGKGARAFHWTATVPLEFPGTRGLVQEGASFACRYPYEPRGKAQGFERGSRRDRRQTSEEGCLGCQTGRRRRRIDGHLLLLLLERDCLRTRSAMTAPRRLLAPLLLQCLLLSGALCGAAIRYSVDEEEPPGTVVGVLAEELRHRDPSADGAPRSFHLVQQADNSSLVRVRERDGQLSLGAARLDREQLCGQAEEPCVLAFDVVSLSGAQPQFRLLHVELEVRDINDHAPRFPQPLLALEVSESAAPGTRLPLELAQDADAGALGVQSFALSPNSHFGLEVQSRADGRKSAELVLLGALDREAQAAFRLELVAKDGGSPARAGSATVSVRVLDANDNAPAFPRGALRTVELPEDAPPGALLLQLDAADPDEGANGQLLYAWGSQVPPEARALFALDARSGRLSLRGAVDYERQRAYELDVQASDRGASPLAASCKVLVRLLDVNDNAPALAVSALRGAGAGAAPSAAPPGEPPGDAPALAYVSEAAPPDSLVALVSASDAGANGQVRCALLAAPHEPFALQRAYDARSYVVLTTGALDRERVPEYNLTLLAEDLGSPPAKTVRRLTVRLADENDNAPRFARPRQELLLPENNPPGAYLGALLASDPDLGSNGRIAYRLLDGEVRGAALPLSTYLSVDARSGELRALRTLDYEQCPQLEAELEACDGGSPRLCQRTRVAVTVVDQNDNPPRITSPPLLNGSADLPLPLGVPVGFLIARIAAQDADDGPNAELTFSLLGAETALFAIGPRTGELFLKQPLPAAGAWTESAFLLDVAVEDGGRPPLACTARLRLIPTDTLPPRVEIVSLQPSVAGEEPLSFSVVFIGVLACGCGVLFVAILLVAASICKSRKTLGTASPESVCKAGRLVPAAGTASSGLVAALSADLSAAPTSQAEGRSGDSLERNLPCYTHQVLVTFPFRSSPVWEGDQSASSFSTRSTPDQLSGKDSGKGDSECNDSDSDVSREGLKKSSAEIIEKQVGQNQPEKSASQGEGKANEVILLKSSHLIIFLLNMLSNSCFSPSKKKTGKVFMDAVIPD